MTLSPQEQRVWDCFVAEPDSTDIPISKLYICALDGCSAPSTTARTMQQRVGGIVSRLNAKTGRSIVPGELKRTYRLEKQEG